MFLRRFPAVSCAVQTKEQQAKAMTNPDLSDDFVRQQAESRLRLQTVFDLSPVGIGVTRLCDGRMIEFNDVLLEIIGFERSDIVGKTSSELAIWDDLTERADIFARLRAGETVRDLATRIRRKDGGVRHVLFSATQCQVRGERLMIGTLRDVTGEHFAEKERQLAEKRLRLSLAAMPIAIFHQDLDLCYTYVVNPQIGQPEEKIVGFFDSDLFEGEDAAALTTIKRRVLATGLGERHEIELRLGGQHRWFDTLIEAERDSGGAIVGLICASADVTERKRRDARYRTVLEDQTELISRYRPDDVMVYVNDVYCRFFGKSAEQLIGQRWQPVAYPEDIPTIKAQLANMSPENPVITIENRVIAGDQGVHWMQFVNRGFFDTDGRLVETQSVGRDITDRKSMERQLSDYRLRLQALLENADHIRENQRKEIAREIHDQLGAIHLSIGFRLEALRRMIGNQSPAETEVTEIKRLLAQAQAAARAICTDLRPPALDDLGLIPTCRWYLKDWSARTRIKARGRFSRVAKGLSEQLSTDVFRAYQELLTNIARHSGAGSVQVSLSSGHQGLRLRVADDGHGFDAESTPKGYGLLGVRERMARYGSIVAIESGPAGTTVSITIPLDGHK